MPFIYKTVNLKNGKIYVGQTNGKYLNYLGSGKLLKNAIRKYGKDNFKLIILEYCKEEDLDSKEIFWIELFKPAYNIDGGGYNRSKKTGLAISLAKKGKTPWNKGKTNCYSAKTIEKMKESAKKRQRGTTNSFYGKKHNKETKKLISKANTIEISKEKELEIIKLYKKYGIKNISKKINLGRKKINNILKRNNVKMREFKPFKGMEGVKGKTAWNRGRKYLTDKRILFGINHPRYKHGKYIKLGE